MDHLIVIRSVTLSNHIARTRNPQGVMASYHRVSGGCGRDNAITPEEEKSYKDQALVGGLKGHHRED
jgi:hypothetical protein